MIGKKANQRLNSIKRILENYNVYLTKAKYEYKGKKYTVQDNELMVAIKI